LKDCSSGTESASSLELLPGGLQYGLRALVLLFAMGVSPELALAAAYECACACAWWDPPEAKGPPACPKTDVGEGVMAAEHAVVCIPPLVFGDASIMEGLECVLTNA